MAEGSCAEVTPVAWRFYYISSPLYFFAAGRCGVKLGATNRPGSIRHERRPSPDNRRHDTRHRRRALPRRHRRVRDIAGRRQRDRCRRRGRDRARHIADRPRRFRRRRADHDLPRREARDRHDRRARHLAARARPRVLHARARRQDPARRLAYRRAGGARRLDHGAEALRHDELRRGRFGRDPARARRVPDVPADGRQHREAAGAAAAMAVERRGDAAERTPAAGRGGVPPDRSRRLVAIHGRRGEGGGGTRPRGRARSGARRLLPRRHREEDRRLYQGAGRAAVGRGHGELPFAGGPARAAPLRRSRSLHLRRVVPGADIAADPGIARRHRPEGARPQQRRLHPHADRGAETRLRRPRGLLHRPGCRQCAAADPDFVGIRRRTAQS